MAFWLVTGKRFSAPINNFIVIEEVVEADKHRTSDCGVLEFYGGIDYDDVIMSVPPGLWFRVEQVEKNEATKSGNEVIVP